MAKKKTDLRSVAQRLSAMPKIVADIGVNGAKYHATACKEVIQDGMRKANLVDKLLDVTVQIKTTLGANRIRTPLMFKGDSDKLSMINGLGIRKIEKRYRLAPYGKHRSGQNQRLIWAIHEKGAIIRVTEKMRAFWAVVFGIFLSKSKNFILIKPRFPLKKGLARYLRSKEKTEVNESLKQAMISGYKGQKRQMKKDMAKWEAKAKKAEQQ